MIKKLILILILTVAACHTLVEAQTIADLQSPKILPPSPDAAALGKYGQIPVDKSTGIPNISVPLYEIKTPRFSLPISLSYHASGIKVDETASWVGLGWSLNAGGVVTRSMLGLPDEGPNGYWSTPNLPTAGSILLNYRADSAFLISVCNNTQDTQPDNFFYNFADQSGAFVFGQDVNHTPLTIPYKPLRITYSDTTGAFTILDEKGDQYFFNNKDVSNSTVNPLLSGPSSWYLTSMISADKSDTIKFYYNLDTNFNTDNSYSFTQNLGPMSNTNSGTQLWPLVVTTNKSYYEQQHLDSIVYRGGKVVFVQKPGRKDNATVSLDSVIVSNYDYNLKKYNRLKSFKLQMSYFHSTLSNPSSTYSANTDTTTSKYRLQLAAVQENDMNNSAIKTTRFSYNSTMLPPLHNYGQDQWGYYNGYSTNQTLLQTQQVIMPVGSGGNFNQNVFTIAGGVGANRSVSPTYMQAGILQQITYPTGGYTVFNFEANQYLAPSVTNVTANASSIGVYQDTSIVAFTPSFANPNQATGQMSFLVQLSNIANISNSYVEIIQASNNQLIYKYNTVSTSNVNTYVPVTVTAGTQYYLVAVSIGGSTSQDISSLPISGISVTYPVTGAPVATNVGGLRVKSIKNYDSNGNILTTEIYKYGANESGIGDFLSYPSLMVNQSQHLYEFSNNGSAIAYEQTYSNSSIYALSSLSGSPVAYDHVTVYHGDTVNNIGKSIYAYTILQDSILVNPNTLVPVVSNFPSLIYSVSQGIRPIPVLWKLGEPTSESDYINTNGQYLLEQVKSTNYNLFYRTGGRGLFVQEAIECPNGGCYVGQQYINSNDYIFYDYPISVGSRQPVQTVTTNYAADGLTQTSSASTKYYYGNLTHMQPTRIVSYDSKQDSTIKTVNYPQDMVIASLDPNHIYSAMSTKNIISPVIQFTQTKDSQQLMQSVTNYSATNGNYNPQTVSLQVLSNPAETRLNYQKYDNNGNLLTVSKQNGDPVSYIWGYKGEYPVAEVKNAQANDIFFESFEDGNSNSVSGDAKTGNYSHLDAYSKALTGLDNGSYTLSYWKKTGAVWAFKDTIVTVSAGTYTISLNAQVDDIRFYPTAAQMTTYTYIPQVGVSSVTDAKGEITYYEYDTMQRLLNIRDQYKNIVKSYCYNYAGQTTGCYIELPSFKNTAKSGGFQKASCGTGYSGSLVTYNVPAGTFTSNVSQSQADSLATNELNKNGQTNANAYGQCLQNISFTMTNNTIASGPGGIAVGMQITFSGPVNLTFTMPSSGSQVIQVPTGTYGISVGADQNNYPHHIQLGSGTPVYNPSTLFSSVSIATGSSTLSLTISN